MIYRNMTDQLGLNTDDVIRLLRAAGADESCTTGGASDRERFDALAAALPLCAGHPLAAELDRRARECTGLSAPLCPHTAEAFWDAWVERHWYGEEPAERHIPAVCPYCRPVTPARLSRTELTPIQSPVTLPEKSLIAWTEALTAATREASSLLVRLPSDYAFVRPDPYHAEQAVTGDGSSANAVHVLRSQMLRTVAIEAAKTSKTLILEGGDPTAVQALLAYLAGISPLPDTVWIPDDPTDAGEVSGLYPSVRTGLCAGASLADYAAVAPIGRAVILTN